jgi:clan AA aspartic protease
MSAFHVNVVAVNPQNQQQTTAAVRALVDTGSELTWLPADVLAAAGIKPIRQRSFATATSQVVSRDVGYAILRAENFETIDEVVFGQPGDCDLLGVRTIEGFGVVVDNIGHRFVARTTLVATAQIQ